MEGDGEIYNRKVYSLTSIVQRTLKRLGLICEGSRKVSKSILKKGLMSGKEKTRVTKVVVERSLNRSFSVL